jgi:hypothetical protein
MAFLCLGRNSRAESTLETNVMVAILLYVSGYPNFENSSTYYHYSPSLLFRVFTITVELLGYKEIKVTEYFVSL